jgi:DNA-binding winged helix-turn-helix (wHTH) protein
LAEVYRRGIIEKNSDGKLEIGPNTYEFLEFLCSGADHIYTRNFFYNLRKRYVKEGRLTRMLKDNYAAMEDIENLEGLEGD